MIVPFELNSGTLLLLFQIQSILDTYMIGNSVSKSFESDWIDKAGGQSEPVLRDLVKKKNEGFSESRQE